MTETAVGASPLGPRGEPSTGATNRYLKEDYSERYPLFDEVSTLRRKVDPDDLFLNAHLCEIFA